MFKRSLIAIFVTFSLFFSQYLSAAASDDFVIQVKTDNTGSSSDTQFTIPTTGTGYMYAVDCNNDGLNEVKNYTASYTCNYAVAGTYTIRIKHNNLTGNGFPRISFSGSGDNLKIVSLDQWGTGHWTSMYRAFWRVENMLTPAVDSPNLSSVTSMDLSYMFYGACNVNPDTSSWNTVNVTDMRFMFSAYACYPAGNVVANPDTSNWITSNVISMQEMFAYQRVANPDTSGWNTTQVINMQAMFADATLADPDTSGWNTVNVENMSGIFQNATSAVPNTSGWDTGSVTNMYAMFVGASSANPDTSSWDVSNVTNMSLMFNNATSANPDTNGWNTGLVTNMYGMFNGATSANPDTSNWNTSSVTNMSNMFNGATSANPNTSGWNTELVTNMSGIFSGATSANPDTSSWNTGLVTNMSIMFKNATSANPDTSGWNTELVTNMYGMFMEASSANPDTNSWDVSKVTNMSLMFKDATSANPDTSGWNTELVTNMNIMFGGATSANPDTSGWDTSSVTKMSAMFSGATSANPDTSSWNTGLVTDMNNMFNGAVSAEPDTSSWNTGLVTNMVGMFYYAVSANPDTSSWNTDLVTNMGGMFYYAESANPDTSSWNVSNVVTMFLMFSGVTIPTVDYDAMLIGFNNQNLINGITFNGGNSQFCSVLAQSARANMKATDNWSITDGGLCSPSAILDMTSATDSGTSQTDDITNDNTPEFMAQCSYVGNTLRLYSNKPVVNTLIATHVCSSIGSKTIAIGSPLANGLQNITYTEQPPTDTASEHSASLVITIDITSPNTPNCTTSPNPANNGASVTTTCSTVEVGSILTIDDMNCPAPTGATGIVLCIGTVGTNAGQITIANDTVTVTDTAGNSNTDAGTGLVIDNIAPGTPVCSTAPNPANNGTAVITTCSAVEVGSTLSITNMSCPAPTGATGIVICTGTVGINAGQITIPNDTVTVTDTAGNTNTDASTGLVIDNVAPSSPTCSTAPNPANNGTAVITTCSAVEVGSTLSITNMSCPAPTGATGIVICTGTVGINAGQITVADDTVTVTDTAGNTNTDASTGLVIDNVAPIGPGSLIAPASLTNDINDDIVGSCGSDATNGVVVVTSLPVNGFTQMYGLDISLDANGGFTIANPNWSEGTYGLYFDCVDEASNAASTFGSFAPIDVDLTVDDPIIDPIATTYLSITGTAEPFATLSFSEVTCSNAPISADVNGDWSCALSGGLSEGVTVTVAATDLAGNVSANATSIVLAVNSAPSFGVYCDIDATDVIGDNYLTIQFPGFIYNMLVGPDNESSQTYDLSIATVTNGDPDLIVDSMGLNNTGELTLTFNINNSGVATLEISMLDNGGTQVGGIDTTTIQFNVHNYADLNLDPRYSDLELNDIIYKNTFQVCR